MDTISTRRFSQNFLATLAISFVAGVGLVALTLLFGYRTTFWLVCGLPLGSFIILWGLQSAPAELRSLGKQLCWWHFLWLFVFLSGQVFRIRDVAAIETNVFDFWALFRIILMGIVAVLLLYWVIFLHNHLGKSFFLGVVGFIAGYCVVWFVFNGWFV